MKLGLVLSLLIFISGCSTTKKENIQNYENIPSQDFIDHYKFLGSNYLSSSNVKEIQLSENSKKYLKNIYNRLITNNEILFQRDEVFNFHVVEDKDKQFTNLLRFNSRSPLTSSNRVICLCHCYCK